MGSSTTAGLSVWATGVLCIGVAGERSAGDVHSSTTAGPSVRGTGVIGLARGACAECSAGNLRSSITAGRGEACAKAAGVRGDRSCSSLLGPGTASTGEAGVLRRCASPDGSFHSSRGGPATGTANSSSSSCSAIASTDRITWCFGDGFLSSRNGGSSPACCAKANAGIGSGGVSPASRSGEVSWVGDSLVGGDQAAPAGISSSSSGAASLVCSPRVACWSSAPAACWSSAPPAPATDPAPATGWSSATSSSSSSSPSSSSISPESCSRVASPPGGSSAHARAGPTATGCCSSAVAVARIGTPAAGTPAAGTPAA
ncbi:MAG: hypothetical protein FJ125_17980, partial [Deltaproteobacteria bacterium]|nr:hypothetical protein [Deltaproteobacteria bacterium]